MHSFNPVGDPPPGSPRAADRSLVVGILLSLGLHVLIVAIFLAVTLGEDGHYVSQARQSPVTTVSLVLLPATGQASASSSRPQSPSAPASVIRSSKLANGASALSTPAAPGIAAHSAPSQASEAQSAPAETAAVTAAAPVDPALGEDYRRRLLAHIAAYRRSPALTPGERSHGLVLIHLAIDRQGDVLSVAVATSSGVADLDDEAVATIWRARPMPPIPLALPGRLGLTLPVSFDPERPAGGSGGG